MTVTLTVTPLDHCNASKASVPELTQPITHDEVFNYMCHRFYRSGTHGSQKLFSCVETGKDKLMEGHITQATIKHFSTKFDILKAINAAIPKLQWIISDEEIYRPNQPNIVDNKGLTFRNSWRPSMIAPKRGNGAEPFLNFLRKVLATEEEVQFLLTWSALLVQHPMPTEQHPKRPIAAYLYSEAQGQGKTTFANVIKDIIGDSAWKEVAGVKALKDQNMVELWGRTLLVAEEVIITKGEATYQRLKALITKDEDDDTLKNRGVRRYETPAHLMMLSNQPPTFLEEQDRRFWVAEFDSGLRGKDAETYFSSIRYWLYNEGGLAEISYLLHNLDISEYRYSNNAPITDAKRRVIAAHQHPFDVELCDLLDNRGTFWIAQDDRELEELQSKHSVSSTALAHRMVACKLKGTAQEFRPTLANGERGPRQRYWIPMNSKDISKSGQPAQFEHNGNTHLYSELAMHADEDDL